MKIVVLNKLLDAIAMVDTYESIIWTERYNEYGDFEIHTYVNPEIINTYKEGYYLRDLNTDRTMIIESINITSDIEDGDRINISGRSLESILDRRIVWGQRTLNGNLQSRVRALLYENVIDPTDPNRKIENLIFKSSEDPLVSKLQITAQYTGTNLYSVISSICEERGLGFKITLNDDKQFVFELYSGVDRSYNQTAIPYVVFSPNFDNLITSNYIESKKNLKTITLIGGAGEGKDRTYVSIDNGGSGLDRRELFTDARDITTDGEDGVSLTPEEYESLLVQRGMEKLSENVDIKSFEGQVESDTMFTYGIDYFNGDIVQIANEYGHETQARISEVVISEDDSGRSVYPTFTNISEKGDS